MREWEGVWAIVPCSFAGVRDMECARARVFHVIK